MDNLRICYNGEFPWNVGFFSNPACSLSDFRRFKNYPFASSVGNNCIYACFNGFTSFLWKAWRYIPEK